MAQLIIPVTLGAEEQIWRFMNEQSKNEDRLQSPQPLTDFYGEDRHELVQNSRTSTGTKEAVRSVRQKSIGLQQGRALVPVGFRN
jgi:hypothetical protein